MSVTPEDVDWETLRQIPSMANLLGCEWGRVLHDRIDVEPCEGMAVQRIPLHLDGGEDFVLVQFCDVHRDRVLEMTTPRGE